MAKGNNKRVKQMIFDVAMQGRKLYWFGEPSEVFIANSKDHLIAEYYDPQNDPEDQECEEVKTNWRVLWKPILCEESVGGAKPYTPDSPYFVVPWISFVWGNQANCYAEQLATSYN